MRNVRKHLTYANVMVTLLAFVVFAGGAAYAADTIFSSDIVDGEVKTADIGNNQVLSADVRNDTLTGVDVDEASLDSSVLQRRLQNGCGAGQAVAAIDAAGIPTCVSPGGPPSGPAGGALTGTYPDPSIAANAVATGNVLDGSLNAVDVADTSSLGTAEINESALFNDNSLAANDIAGDAVGNAEVDGSLTGANIADTGGGSLHGADISESSLTKVPDADKLDGSDSVEYTNPAAYDFDNPGCDPTTTTYISCVDTGITLPSTSNVLVIANGGFSGEGIGPDDSLCRLQRDGAFVSGGFSTSIGVGQQGTEHSVFREDGFARSAIDVNVPAGAHTWSLACDEGSGDAHIYQSQIVVMRLSG